MHVCPSNVSGASLIDQLAEAKVHVLQPLNPVEPYIEFHSLAVCSHELEVLLPAYDQTMMPNLTDLWDCGEVFDQKLRKHGKEGILIKNPQVNMLVATTPGQLQSFLPNGAWDKGFMARVIPIFNSEKIIKPLFGDEFLNGGMPAHNLAGYDDMLADLKRIGGMFGQYRPTLEVMHALNKWVLAGDADAPKHPRFAHYNTRRTHNLLKLCMIAAAQSRDDLTIELGDLDLAINWMVEAEFHMEHIFAAMTTGGDGAVMEEAQHWIAGAFIKLNGKGVSKRLIIKWLSSKVPNYSVMKVFENLVAAGMITSMNQLDQGGSELYRPVPKESSTP